MLLSCRLFLDNLESILSKQAQEAAKEQDPAHVTHADKLEKNEGLLRWSRSATELHNQVISNLVFGNLCYSFNNIHFLHKSNIIHRNRLVFV